MERLIILSDLWGKQNTEWTNIYFNLLKNDFELKWYDVRELAGIDSTIVDEEKIHSQFLQGGIKKAIKTLTSLEKYKVNILGFSIGGYIAWETALETNLVTHLTAVSSTRLRFETKQPQCFIKLYFGENDINAPDDNWFKHQHLKPTIIKSENHNFYTKEMYSINICKEIIRNKNYIV